MMYLRRFLFLTLAGLARAQDGEGAVDGNGDGAVDGEPERAPTRPNLIQLIPFQVQIALEDGRLASEVDDTVVEQAVTEWMSESFREKSVADGMPEEGITFGLVDISRVPSAIAASSSPSLYVASYTGTSLWDVTGDEVDPERVHIIQRFTFIEGRALEQLLTAASDETGLGAAVKDASAFITPDAGNAGDDAQNAAPAGDDGGNNNNLEIIIIVAIIVACLAFVLLTFAVCWAWKTDRERRSEDSVTSSYAGKQQPQAQQQHQARPNISPDGTGSESEYDGEAPRDSNLDGAGNDSGGHYPDSVISDDISTSLTAYYRSGMSGYNMPRRGQRPNDFNDAASMSSMDSYGYSLDGYAPSLSGGPTQMGYPVGQDQQHQQQSPSVAEDDHPAGRR